MVRIDVEGFRGNWNGTRKLRSGAMTGEKEKQSGDKRKEVDKDNNEKNGRKCRCSVTNEAIFQMKYIVSVHIHAIHLLYHRTEGDL